MRPFDSAREKIDELMNEHEAHERLDLLFADCHFEVLSNSRRLLEKLAYYYKDFVGSIASAPDIRVVAVEAEAPRWDLDYRIKKPDPGKTKIKEEYVDFADGRVVHKRLTGMAFIFGGDKHLAVGPCTENDNQVINFINNRFIQYKLNRGCLLGHAAAVTQGGRGLAMAGFSGAGKSTLALHIMSLGTSFVSNDRLMIQRDDGLKMFGVAKLPRINPGTILGNDSLRTVMPDSDRRKVLELTSDELWGLEQKYDAFIDQCFGPGRFELSSSMDGLVILNWKRDAGPAVIEQVDPRERRDLLGAFMKSVGLFYEGPLEGDDPDFSEDAYLEQLSDCPMFEFSGGVDFERAAESCFEFLRTGVMPLRAH